VEETIIFFNIFELRVTVNLKNTYINIQSFPGSQILTSSRVFDIILTTLKEALLTKSTINKGKNLNFDERGYKI